MEKRKILMTFMESGMGHITSIKSISDNMAKYYGDKYEIINSYIMQEDKDPTLIKFENFIIKQTKNTNCIKGFGFFIFFVMNLLGRRALLYFTHKTFFKKALDHALMAFKKRDPDVIVSTHYFLTYCAIEYKKKVNPKLKIITYNPDNNIHPWWDNRDGLFIVNNEQAKIDAIKKNKFKPSQTRQVYFTARNEILDANESKEFYREKLGISKDKFCVIIADGVYAMGKSKQICKELLKGKSELTVIMLAGKNEKLFNYFTAQINKMPSNITLIVLPFKKDIHEYYKASDLFITKAGPNAILDSVFMDTPVIVDYYAHPIEKATTHLFINSFGCGEYITSPIKIRERVEQIAQSPYMLNPYIQNCKKIDKKLNGGKDVAKIIDEYIEN